MPKDGMMKNRGPSAKGATYMNYGRGAMASGSKTAPPPPGMNRGVRAGSMRKMAK